MNDPTKELLSQLEQATSRDLVRPTDEETAMLRESWLMLGQLLDAADVDLQDPATPVVRPATRWRSRLGVIAMIAASLLVALGAWTLLRPVSSDVKQPQIATPGDDLQEHPDQGDVQVADNDSPSTEPTSVSSAFAWDDSLDDSLAAAENAIRDVRGGWNRGYGQVDTLTTRMQEYQQDLAESSL